MVGYITGSINCFYENQFLELLDSFTWCIVSQNYRSDNKVHKRFKQHERKVDSTRYVLADYKCMQVLAKNEKTLGKLRKIITFLAGTLIYVYVNNLNFLKGRQNPQRLVIPN